MGASLQNNTWVLLAGVGGLVASLILVSDPTLHAVAIGALAGIVGGHANGSQRDH